MAITKSKGIEDATVSKKQKCKFCGKDKAYSNFYKSNATMYKANKGIMYYCKDCIIKEYLKFLTTSNGNETLAIKLTCCEFNITFNNSFYEGAISEAKNRREKESEERGEKYDSRKQIEDSIAFGNYMKNLNSLGKFNNIQDDGFDYVSNLQVSEDESTTINIFNEKAKQLKVTNEMIEFWDGVKDRKKLYILEKIWNEYQNSYKITNPVHVKLFKECAFLELQSIETRNANVNADVSENTKKITDLLNSLKLLPKNKKEDGEGADVCDGIAVRAAERTHPIPDTQWKDKENFMKCIGYMWRGHTMYNMGVQDNNPEYAKIMKDLAIESNVTGKKTEDGDK